MNAKALRLRIRELSVLESSVPDSRRAQQSAALAEAAGRRDQDAQRTAQAQAERRRQELESERERQRSELDRLRNEQRQMDSGRHPLQLAAFREQQEASAAGAAIGRGLGAGARTRTYERELREAVQAKEAAERHAKTILATMAAIVKSMADTDEKLRALVAQ